MSKKRNIPTRPSHIEESRVLLTPSQTQTRTHDIVCFHQICVPSARQRPAQRYISWKIRAAAELLHSIQVFSKTRARCGTFCNGCCKGASTACLWKHSVQLFQSVHHFAASTSKQAAICWVSEMRSFQSFRFWSVRARHTFRQGTLNRWCAFSARVSVSCTMLAVSLATP